MIHEKDFEDSYSFQMCLKETICSSFCFIKTKHRNHKKYSFSNNFLRISKNNFISFDNKSYKIFK